MTVTDLNSICRIGHHFPAFRRKGAHYYIESSCSAMTSLLPSSEPGFFAMVNIDVTLRGSAPAGAHRLVQACGKTWRPLEVVAVGVLLRLPALDTSFGQQAHNRDVPARRCR